MVSSLVPGLIDF